MTVAVVRLGVGNTASVMFALERAGARPVLSDDPAVLGEADRIVLPGVGAAGFAMDRIRGLGLADLLRDFDRPLLGICLGQQLLFERSEEGDTPGLGRIEGAVRRFDPGFGLPTPHMGWNRIAIDRPDPLLEGIAPDAHVYFAHSFVCPLNEATLASGCYGEPFAAVVRQGLAWGCQFHPERSSTVGARLISNFLALPC